MKEAERNMKKDIEDMIVKNWGNLSGEQMSFLLFSSAFSIMAAKGFKMEAIQELNNAAVTAFIESYEEYSAELKKRKNAK